MKVFSAVENSTGNEDGTMTLDQRTGCCLLCHSANTALFHQIGAEHYHRCNVCQFVFLTPEQMPSLAIEQAEYDMHENDPDDIHYRAFLRRATEPLIEKIPSGSYGLDYGCGPGPALAAMLSERGFSMEIYDPIYANDEDVLEEAYDFITCTEVAEHFHYPAKEFDQFDRLLNPGGWLAIMTSWLTADIQFDQWYYRRDPTHVCFYSTTTLKHWADTRGWRIEFPRDNVALLQKPNCPS